jgi:uncharacterized protein (TIGR02145 family)
MNKIFFLLSILFFLTNACKKIERINPRDGIAGVTTSEAKQLDLSTLQIISSLTSIKGVAYVTQRGICWSTSPNPTTNDNFTNEGSGFGTFESKISGLSVNTTYYFRAFASNDLTTAYGNEVVYKINGPIITTKTPTEVAYTTVKIGCALESDAGYSILKQGICWNDFPNVDTLKNKIVANSKDFDYTLSGLENGKTYYYKSFVLTGAGIVFGKELSFSTLGFNTPSLLTKSITNIGSDGANSGGEITSDGGQPILEKGICVSLSPNPSISDFKTTDGIGKESFTSKVTALKDGTTYYVRAYATNARGTGYGNEVQFTTFATYKPTVLTTSISSVTKISAISGGTISSDGGLEITSKGICWSTKSIPTINDNKTSDGIGISLYTSQITGLTAGTTYYVRAYATNAKGTSYGNEVIFTTVANTIPTITTNAITAITRTSASSGGTINSNGGLLITAKGICWSTKSNPTITDSKTTDGTGNANFTSLLEGLIAGTTYYVRAYATNDLGTSYGNEVSLTTNATTTPILSTISITSITKNSAASGGTINSDGGLPITAKGICWSTNNNPTLSDTKTTDGTGDANFISQLNGLSPGTTYYIRAYATNSLGTSYGSENSFSTITSLPILSTASITSITKTSAVSGGEISSDGGLPITEKGICWSTKSSPTKSDSKTTEGIGIANFTSQLAGLLDGATYYVRSYATNANGTSYGNEINFTTESYVLPVIQTVNAANISRDNATCGGIFTVIGDLPILAKGVCWSLQPTPTINDNKIVEGSGSGGFQGQVTGLLGGSTYYVRAYFTTEKGTYYGNEVSFVTNIDGLGPLISDIDGNSYKTVYIGTQQWMAENLKTAKFSDGTSIQNVTDNIQWRSNTTKGAWCYYNNDITNNDKYGKLYNWYTLSPTANGNKNVCPTGWHVPTEVEWIVLTDYLGGASVAGGKMKELGTTSWKNPNVNATNKSGFSGIPGGYRNDFGVYSNVGEGAYWWSSLGNLTWGAKYTNLSYYSESVFNDVHYEDYGLSVRCIKD